MAAIELSGTTYSEVDASNNAASPNGMPEGMAPSGVNDAWRGGTGALKRTWDRDHASVATTVGGTGNAVTLTYVTSPAAYVQGERFAFKATAANTGATTVAVNALGVKSVFRKGNAGAVACVGAEINVGDLVELEYDGTQFQIQSDTPVPAASAAVTLAGVDNALALTAAGFAGNKSLGTNGYYKLPGGMIIQWGTVTETGPVIGTVGLSVSFASTFFGIVITPLGNPNSSVPTASPATLATWTFGQAATTGALNYFWIALGI